MNEKNSKQLRRLAKGLPVVWIVKHSIEFVMGRELTKRQREMIPGKVQVTKMYKVDKEITAKQDHVKNVFTIFEKQGEVGLSKYVASVYNVHRKQQEDFKKYPHRHPEILLQMQKTWWQKIIDLIKNIFLHKEKQLNTINS